MIAGILIVAGGYAGTLWCYGVMGDSWRIGIDRTDKTALVKNGPYRFLRHPIYLFQSIILIGVCFLLPTPFSFLMFLLQLVCAVIKARDEEAYLLAIHGSEYSNYISGTGMLLPGLKRRSK
jgi:protein-S-isoprenylcysteine O-methyltransferase Ste14